jgi:RecA/RadA recombinase
MAKRKKAVEQATNADGQTLVADRVLAESITAVEAKSKKKNVLIGNNPLIHVLPVPSIAMRYLIQNEGWPLSSLYQIVGPEGSFKSTFAIEVGRWHALCGGKIILCEAESKPTPDLRNAILNHDEGAIRVEDCASIEDWQRKIIWYSKELKKKMEAANGPGRTIPICFIVDSLTGKAAERTIDKIMKEGHASPHFAIEAGSIADWMRTYPQQMLEWPFNLLGVNHLKANLNPMTGFVDRNIPGGWSLKFQETMELELKQMGSVREMDGYNEAVLLIQTYKNSHGKKNVTIQVNLRLWQQEDAPGVFRLHGRFEWWESAIYLLLDGLRMKDDVKARLLPRIKEVVDLHRKNCGNKGNMFWSDTLGVPSSDPIPAHDLGVKLEQRSDILAKLYPILNIHSRPFFKPGVDFLSQLEDYKHLIDQMEASQKLLIQKEELKMRPPPQPPLVVSNDEELADE